MIETNIQEEIENRIIDLIALGSEGRLVATKPVGGVDLTVEKRADYKADKISLRVFLLLPPQMPADVLAGSFGSDKNLYFVFAYFDEIKRQISDEIYIIPSAEAKAGVDFKKNIMNKKELARFLLEAFEK